MARLLVSVRSAPEARAALAGGAAIIDVKEPDRGPLGRAHVATWRAVRAAVPARTPVSVALGELRDWGHPPTRPDYDGIAYRKLGLAGAGRHWQNDWAAVRRAPGPGWIAVAYADWEAAGSPRPDEVLEAAIETGCAGLLIDTWDKRQRAEPGPLPDWIERARGAGLLVALAGGLDEDALRRLAPLRPDVFAVRGAACTGGDRLAAIDPHRVARLAAAAERAGAGSAGRTFQAAAAKER